MSGERLVPRRKQSTELSAPSHAGAVSNLTTAGSEPTPSSEAPETPANSLSISKQTYDPEHPAAHLRKHQFKPGVSGNPSGRPKSIFGATALKRLLRAGKDGESKLIALIDAQIDKAIRKRDTRAAEFLRDSVDGRPTANDDSRQIGGRVTIIWNGDPPPWAQPIQIKAPSSADAATEPKRENEKVDR